jgi:hypothetical protein
MSEINFNGYKSYDGKVSEAEFNKLVDLTQSLALNQGVGYRLSRNPIGTTLAIKLPTIPSGNYSNPYVLGSLNHASSQTGISGIYGGSADIQTGNASGAYLDTWHRDFPPLDSGNNQTYGVKLDLIRPFINTVGTYSFHKSLFTRNAIFDDLGDLVSISAEMLEEDETASGSGSAGGGI